MECRASDSLATKIVPISPTNHSSYQVSGSKPLFHPAQSSLMVRLDKGHFISAREDAARLARVGGTGTARSPVGVNWIDLTHLVIANHERLERVGPSRQPYHASKRFRQIQRARRD